MLLLCQKMKSTSFFLSNEPYGTFRGQKSLKLQSFKVNTAKDNGFSRIFNRFRSQRECFQVLFRGSVNIHKKQRAFKTFHFRVGKSTSI